MDVFRYIGSLGSLLAWLIGAGIALRMAQDLGLHRELNISSGEEGKACTSPVDAESWRRMFLNCYISDKFPLKLFSRKDLWLIENSGCSASSLGDRSPFTMSILATRAG